MLNSKTMWFLLIAFLIKLVSSSFLVADQCINICKDAKLPALELDQYEQVVCQRGCRFFNIIKFKDLKINATRKECYISCDESYIVQKENEICQTGCDLMTKQQEVFISSVSVDSSIVLASPDRDIEFDLISDPSLKNQLEVGFNVDYKIPETHIRTMPIEITEEQVNVLEPGDWLDCASKNSGIPRWILLTAILSVVLIALWLSLANDKRGIQEEIIAEVDLPDDKFILENEEFIVQKDVTLLKSDLTEYNTESEKV